LNEQLTVEKTDGKENNIFNISIVAPLHKYMIENILYNNKKLMKYMNSNITPEFDFIKQISYNNSNIEILPKQLGGSSQKYKVEKLNNSTVISLSINNKICEKYMIKKDRNKKILELYTLVTDGTVRKRSIIDKLGSVYKNYIIKKMN
jgi:hypothetical protein